MSGVNMVDVTDREIFKDGFKDDYERVDSELEPLVNNDGMVRADFANWDILGNVDPSEQRERDGAIPEDDLDLGRVRAELREEYKRFGIDDFDIYRHNPSLQQAQYKKSVIGCNKGKDRLIVNTLASSTNIFNGGAPVSFRNFGTYLQLINRLVIDEVPSGENELFMLMTPTAEAAILRYVEEYKNRDYVEIGAVQRGAGTKKMERFANACIKTHTGLRGHGTANAECYVFHKSAICYMNDGTPTTNMYYSNERDRYETWARIRHAATIGLPRGVLKFTHDDLATQEALND